MKDDDLISLDNLQNLFDDLGMQDFARVKWDNNSQPIFSVDAVAPFTSE
jgi:hypothetical protein